jgi:hypothetical protein
MFNQSRSQQFVKYNEVRKRLIASPEDLISLEKICSDYLSDIISENIAEIARDYNEATYLYPFWQNYPPDNRGRQPIGDQYPWIEVGEHVFGEKLARLFSKKFEMREPGVPTGPDLRFVIKSDEIFKVTNGLTDQCWLFIDIKSVGPRDNFSHTVMSHNQISGDGLWDDIDGGVHNTIMKATGPRQSHTFHCSIPPFYILSDGTVLPVVILAIKPIYEMLSMNKSLAQKGQPLKEIVVVTIPNGILLGVKPGYLKQFPRLLFPGKDDKGKNPLKIRARVSFDILKQINEWRIKSILT